MRSPYLEGTRLVIIFQNHKVKGKSLLNKTVIAGVQSDPENCLDVIKDLFLAYFGTKSVTWILPSSDCLNAKAGWFPTNWMVPIDESPDKDKKTTKSEKCVTV